VQMKYQMTAPKVAMTSGPTLSDGRRQPVIPFKIMLEIETQNPHLARSRITDEIVWKDCTNFQFKPGGHSRPEVMILPWRQQVEDMKRIGSELESFWDQKRNSLKLGGEAIENNQKDDDDDDDDDDEQLLLPPEEEAQSSSRATIMKIRNLQKYISILTHRPMSVPLLLQSGIGKAVKKFVKQNKKLPSSSSLILQQLNNDPDLQSQYKGRSYLAQMEILLNEWKTMASSTPGQDEDVSCSGRHRNTSVEQYLQDLEDVQKTTQWRDLFQVLSAREKIIIKTRGAKMRKIREDIETDRHRIKSTKLKKAGNQKLSEKLLYGDKPANSASGSGNSTGSVAGSGSGGGGQQISKLNKLRQESLARQKTISGLSTATKRATSFGTSIAVAAVTSKPSKSPGISSFGSSVAASSGKKRKSVGSTSAGGDNLQAFGSKRKNQRVFSLGDGKKIKLPSNMRGKK